MSLIAEALRAAQREQDQRTAELTQRAQTLFRPGAVGWTAPLDRLRREKRPGLSVLLALGGAGIAVAAIALLAVGSTTGTGWQVRSAGSPSAAAPPAAAPGRPTVPAVQSQVRGPVEPAALGPAAPPKDLEPAASTQAPEVASTDGVPRAPEPAGPAAPAPNALARRGDGTTSRGLRVTLAPEGKDADLDRLLEQALAFQRAANHRAAVEVYERIIARLPTDARAYNNLAAAYRALGELQQAREALRRAIELDPRYAAAWSNLGLVLDALGERQQAATAFQTALRLDPGNTAASVNLAIQYHQAGLLDEANALLQEALRRDPLMPEAHYELGRLSETRGDRDQALRHYRRFLEIGAQRFPEVAARVRERMAQLTR